MKQVRNSKKRAGRPAESKTRYPGIMTFSRHIGVSHQFVRSVLDGTGVSGRVTREWSKWQAQHQTA